MENVTEMYAERLLHFAVEHDQLQRMFRQTCEYLGKPLTISDKISKEMDMAEKGGYNELEGFLSYLSKNGHEEEVHGVLESFLDKARENLGITAIEVITAVPLTQEQMEKIYRKLIRHTKRPLQLIPYVDKSVLGGIRLVGGGMVVDTTIKQQLNIMRERFYKEVYESE